MNGQKQVQVPSRSASRALDAQIAEKVMGWTPVPTVGHTLWRKPGEGPAKFGGPDSHPHYSTDIGAAWLVVEEMVRRGWIIDVQNRQLVRWACHVNFPAPNYRHVFETEDTAPLAICRAALAAVEVV